MQNRLNKHGAVVKNAPAVLAEKWDRHKTVHQNFKAMGLMPSMKVHASGGSDEKDLMEERNRLALAGTKATTAVTHKAKVIRDDQGNIVDVIDDEPTYEEKLALTKPGELPHKLKAKAKAKAGAQNAESTPWGAPLNDSDDDDTEALPRAPAADEDEYNVGGADLDGGITRLVRDTAKLAAKAQQMSKAEREARDKAVLLPARRDLDDKKHQNVAAFHASLEALSAQRLDTPSVSFNSGRENDWLRSIIAKHGDDLDAAARDRVVNPWQKTKGEIRRAYVHLSPMHTLRHAPQAKRTS